MNQFWRYAQRCQETAPQEAEASRETGDSSASSISQGGASSTPPIISLNSLAFLTKASIFKYLFLRAFLSINTQKKARQHT